MGYVHVQITNKQSSKHGSGPCGDVVLYERTSTTTTLICCDGIGSGIKANLAATMCVSRLKELLRGRFSLREAFASTVKTMNMWKDPQMPYAVFTVARILNDGSATILGYEMPSPIFISGRQASILEQQTLTIDNSLVSETTCQLAPGDGLLIVSDGITQAGLGAGLANGWCIENVCKYINEELAHGRPLTMLPELVHEQARGYWGAIAGDDCTAVLASCRWGKTVTVFTGPPSHSKIDSKIVDEFLKAPGQKVVCGATTAQIVARHTGTNLSVKQGQESMIAPPKYEINGIDLVTEGAVTLNQVYNVLDADPTSFEEESGVTELCELLQSADCITFIMGQAMNPASENISFRQKGILTRATIVPLLADKLRKIGKLVLIRAV